MVDFSQKCIFVVVLPKSQSHRQIQCCQCVVGCQCLSNVLCSFCSNFIDLCMVDFSQKFIFVVLLPKSQSHPQIQCCQCVVGCQSLSKVLCSFSSNFIPL